LLSACFYEGATILGLLSTMISLVLLFQGLTFWLLSYAFVYVLLNTHFG